MSEAERRERIQIICDAYNKSKGDLDKTDGHDCPYCLNKGYLMMAKEIDDLDGKKDYVESIEKCSCWPIRSSIMRLKRSGLGNVMIRYTFEKFETSEPWQEHIKDTALRFIAENGRVFFIGGNSGSGKTHICTAITAELMHRGKAAYYMLWHEDVVKLKACVLDSEEYQSRMMRLKEIDVLYIDDFLKPVSNQESPTAADARIAYELINHRYNNGKLITVISSERLIGEILNIDEATGGRIVEYAGEYMINIKRDRSRNYRLRGL